MIGYLLILTRASSKHIFVILLVALLVLDQVPVVAILV